LNNTKIIFLFIFFSLLICQESSFFKSYKKQGSFVISGSLYSTFTQEENSGTQNFKELKFDYKIKGPLGLWVGFLNDDKSDVNVGTLGFGYFFKTKKWDLALLTEKSFYSEKYTVEELSEVDESYEYKLCWLYNLKRNIPFYLKYVNSYHKTSNNSYNKKDYLFIGSYSIINNIILSYNVGLKIEDLLKLDFNTGRTGLTFGYKF